MPDYIIGDFGGLPAPFIDVGVQDGVIRLRYTIPEDAIKRWAEYKIRARHIAVLRVDEPADHEPKPTGTEGTL